jgi:hypothetical protein
LAIRIVNDLNFFLSTGDRHAGDTDTTTPPFHFAMSLVIHTALGNVTMRLRADAAPVTVEYIRKCVEAGLYT